jgi:very-short-patch-repair endonuclease
VVGHDCPMSGGLRRNDEIADESSKTPRERTVARLANSQHGLISLAQLRDLGLSESAVRSRVSTGRLHRVHRGVYAAGHGPLTAEAGWIGAVLSFPPDALLSHRSAAALWGLRPTGRAAVELTVKGRRPSRPGIHVHDGGTLSATDRAIVRGIPCTSVARTLLDLAEVVDLRALERAWNQAEVLRLLDLRSIAEVLGRANGRRGGPILAAVATARDAERCRTRSELERRFLTLCDHAGLARPQVNVHMEVGNDAFEIDFLWPNQGLAVETDGYAFHRTRGAFEGDRLRDQRLATAGLQVLRCSWRQVTHDPHALAQRLQAALATRAEARK